MLAVASFWDARHRSNKTGIPNPQSNDAEERHGFSTNICFLLGMKEICEQLQTLRMDTLSILGRSYSDFRDHIFKGEMVVIKIEPGLGDDGKNYFIARSNGYSIGVVPVTSTPPIKLEQEMIVYLHTRYNKRNLPSFNEAIIVK
jgi:hypothetical protein